MGNRMDTGRQDMLTSFGPTLVYRVCAWHAYRYHPLALALRVKSLLWPWLML